MAGKAFKATQPAAGEVCEPSATVMAERYDISIQRAEKGGLREAKGVRRVDAVGRLDSLLRRKVITPTQYQAGDRYRSHWYCAGLDHGVPSVDLARVYAPDFGNFSGMAKTEQQYSHRKAYRAAVQVVGAIGAMVIERIVCSDESLTAVGYALRWRNKSQAISAATERLREALDRLCVHWKL